MSGDWRRGALIGAVLTLVGVGIALCASPNPKPDMARAEALADSVARVVARASAEAERARNDRALLVADLTRRTVERDLAVRQHRRSQAALDSARGTLPRTPSPDSCPAAYDRAVAQLDGALGLVTELQATVSADSGLLGDTRNALTLAEAEMAAERTISTVARASAAEWERSFRNHVRQTHPWCGKKCGIALGVGSTIVVAVAVNQLNRLQRR